MTIGETMRIVVSLRNTSDHAVTLPSVRADLEDAIPTLGDIPLVELRGNTGSEPITLSAGETRELIFEAVPFASGSEESPEEEGGGSPQPAIAPPVARPSAAPHKPAPLRIEDGTLTIRSGDRDIEVPIPNIELQVQSVLTPDWKERGPMDNFDVRKSKLPRALWLMAVPLAGLLAAASARLLAARRPYKKPAPAPKLLEETRRRIASLENRLPELSGPAFYDELLGILDTFLVDFYGLPKRQRGAESLVEDIASWLWSAQVEGRWAPAHLALAEKTEYIAQVAVRAEQARSSERAPEEALRRADLQWLKSLVAELAPVKNSSESSKGASLMGMGALLLGTTLEFTRPWAALLLVPLGLYLLAQFLLRKTPRGLKGVSSALLPAHKSPRERLARLPFYLRLAALALLTVALINPVVGFTRMDKYVPSTDTAFMIDVSGSMSESMRNPDGKTMTKLQAAIESATAYNEEQRRGTTNRLAVGHFDDHAYLPLRLTSDNDAVNAALKELQTKGSTAIGAAIMHAITHFIEINIEEMSDPDDPRVAQVREILDKKGLGAALAFAHQDPALEKMVLQPQRTKVIILYTDGQSNTDISPIDAAQIAQSLNAGFHIYTIGINTTNDAASEAVLRQVSMITGAVRRDAWGQPLRDTAGNAIPGFYRSTSPEEMRQALLDIARLEKSPVLDRKQLALNDYQLELALAALGLLTLEQILAATRLRGLPAVILLVGMMPGHSAHPASTTYAAQAQPAAQAPADKAPAPDPAKEQPNKAPGSRAEPEGDAAKEVRPAAAQDILDVLTAPDMPAEVRLANRLYHMGRYDEALKKYAEALAKYPDLAELYFNMGNAYLRMGDADRAMKSYQEYLKRAPNPSDKAKALFNMGNAALGQKDAARAIELYRQALEAVRDSKDAPRGDMNNPNFRAQWNLEYVTKMLQQQDQQQQQQDGQDQRQSQKQKQKKNKNKNQKGQRQQQQQSQQNQQGDPQNDSGDEEQEQQGDQQSDQQKPGQSKNQQGDQEQQEQKGMPQEAQADAKEQAREKALDALGKYAEQTDKNTQAAQRAQARQGGKSAWGFIGLPLLAAGGLGSTVVFANPLLMWTLLAGVPILLLLMRYGLSRAIADARKVDPDHAPKSFRSWPGKWLWRTSTLAFATALISLILSIGRPTAGEADVEHNFGGKDAVFVVGVSNSEIYAEDGRFQRSKTELSEFLDHLQGTDRVGLVAVAGEARTATPLTVDPNAVSFKVRRLEREALGLQPGSRLGAGLLHAIKISQPPVAKKVAEHPVLIFVISDGEISDEGDKAKIDEAVKLASQRHIPIYTIGVGSPEGSQMSMPNADGASMETVMDPQTGQPAITHLNEGLLRDIAQKTGGAYFPAGQRSIDAILSQVAQEQNGAQKNLIKTPLIITGPFLALAWLPLLIELLLKRRPLLDKGNKLGGFALLGLPAIPLHAWPILLIALTPIALLSALLALDVWTGGALSRRVRHWLRRAWPGPALAARDLDVLFDLRDSSLIEPHRQPRARLSAFLSAWKSADAPLKRALLEAAQADEELWREKLIVALLCESSPESASRVLQALDSASKRYPLDSLEPVRRRVLDARKSLEWLNYPRLSWLWERWEKHPASRPSRMRRASALLLALPVALALAVLPVAAQKTQFYRALQNEQSQVALNIFYDKDSDIFYDHYIDPRIPDALATLRRWSESGETHAAALSQAVSALHSSPDPKADNVLVAMFNHAELLGLPEQAKDELYQALLERDNEIVWKFLSGYMEAHAEDPAATGRLLRMLDILARADTPKAFARLFGFLSSPQPQIRLKSELLIRSELLSMDDARALDGLRLALDQHAMHADVPLWTLTFLLERLSRPDFEPSQFEKSCELLTAAIRADQRQDPKSPDRALALLEQAIDQAKRAGAVPDVLAYATQELIFSETSSLLLSAVEVFPVNFRADLEDNGVLLSSQYPSSNKPHRPLGARPQQRPPQPVTRKLYTLRHLRLILEEVKKVKSPLSSFQRIKKQESEHQFERLISLAEKSGLRAGDSPGEAVAQQLNYRLFNMPAPTREIFHAKLMKEGLAPKVQRSSLDPETSYRPSYTPEQIEKIRLIMAEALQNRALGAGPRASLTLDWEARRFFAQKLPEIEAFRDELCAETGAPLPATASKHASRGQEIHRQFEALKDALREGNTAAAEQAGQALSREYDSAWSKDLFLAQLHAAKTEIDPPAFRAWALCFLMDRLVGPNAREIHPEGARELVALFAESTAYNATEVWADVVKALDRVGHGTAVPRPFQETLPELLNHDAAHLVDYIRESYPDLEEKLLQTGVLKPKNAFLKDDHAYTVDEEGNTYSPCEVKGNALTRDNYGTAYLRRLGYVLNEYIASKDEAWKKEHAEVNRDTLALIDSLAKAGSRLGMPQGGFPADLAADEINQTLAAGIGPFSSDWDQDMIQAGLRGPKNYFPRYTAPDIHKAREFLSHLLETGYGPDGQPLEWEQALYLANALEHLDIVLAKYYPGSYFPSPTLGRIALGFKGADPAVPARADQAMRKELDSAQNSMLLLSRLSALQTRYAQDPNIQAWVASYLAQRMAHSDELARAEHALAIWNAAAKVLADAGRGAEPWAILEKNLAQASPLVRDFARQRIADQTSHIILDALASWGGIPPTGEIVSVLSEAKMFRWATVPRARYSQRHLMDLLGIIRDQPANSRAQIHARESAMRILPLLQKLAPKFGMLPGDTPEEKAAEEINPILMELHNNMGGTYINGQYYVDGLRQAKLAPEVSRPYPVYEDYSFAPAYSIQDLRKLRDFHQKILASGLGWGPQGKRPLDQAQRELLRKLIDKCDELIRAYPSADIPTLRISTANAFLPLLFAATPGLHGPDWLGPIMAYWPVALAATAAVLALHIVWDMIKALRKAPELSANAAHKPLEDVLKHYRGLDIAAQKIARAMTGGSFRSRFVGLGGTDFADIKEYQGESARHIHWRLSAKYDKPLVKRHEQEKDMPLILAVDLSASSSLGTRAADKRDVIQDAAALLALVASRRNVRVGAVFFTDRVEKYIPPISGGPKQAWTIIREMAALTPQGRGTDLRAPLSLIGKEAGAAAMVAVISDFLAPEDFSSSLKSLAARGHDVLPLRVMDPADGVLPKAGLLSVYDSETGQARTVDTSNSRFRAEQMELVHQREEALKQAFRGARVPVTISTEGDYVEALAERFQPKKR